MKQLLAFVAALPFILFAFAAHAATTDASNPATRSFAATVPAASLKTVKLDILVGHANVTVADTNDVKVRVQAEPGGHGHFIFDWTWGNQTAKGLPADLHLVTHREDDTLVLCLASSRESGCDMKIEEHDKGPAGASSGGRAKTHNHVSFGFHSEDSGPGWKTQWTVILPARLALNLQLGVGDGEVRGVAGGLETDIGVGHLDTKLPQGPINASIGVGHVEAVVGSADYGPVDLTAGVGHVEFEVNGHDVSTGVEKQFTAASQKLNGPGRTAYTLQAGVGHVQLKLGVKGLASLPPVTASAPRAASAPAPASQTKPAVPASAPRTTPAPATATSERL